MLYQVKIRKLAAKFLAGIPPKDRFRIYIAIELLRENPLPPKVRKVKGLSNHYRVRIGDYRIVYQIFQDQLVIEVFRVGFRRDFYCNL